MPAAKGQVVSVKNYPKNTNFKLDDGEFYGGFNSDIRTTINEGDVVEFEWQQNGKFKNVIGGTLTNHGNSGQQQQAAQSAPQGGTSKASDYVDSRQLSIHYQSSRNAAIEFVRLALEQETVKLPTKQADKYDALEALVKEQTDRFHVQLEQVIKDGGVQPDVPTPGGG